MSDYRVPCQIQLKAKVFDQALEAEFKEHVLKPAGLSQVRNDLEHHLQASGLALPMRNLMEQAFGLLISLQQRLERVETHLEKLLKHDETKPEFYEAFSAEIGAESIRILNSKGRLPKGDRMEFDILLSCFPEHRVLCLVTLLESGSPEASDFKIDTIHESDREFLYRFMRQRERELVRNRQSTE